MFFQGAKKKKSKRVLKICTFNFTYRKNKLKRIELMYAEVFRGKYSNVFNLRSIVLGEKDDLMDE